MILLVLNLIFCNSYESNTTEKLPRSIVLSINEQTARTYIHEIGYIEWEIVQKSNEILDSKTNILQHGEYRLKNQFGHSTLYVTDGYVIHYAYFNIDGHEFKFNIQYGRKIHRKRHKESSNKRVHSGEFLTGEHITPRRCTVGKLQEIFTLQ